MPRAGRDSMEVLFWISLFAVVYPYAIYPALLVAWNRLAGRRAAVTRSRASSQRLGDPAGAQRGPAHRGEGAEPARARLPAPIACSSSSSATAARTTRSSVPRGPAGRGSPCVRCRTGPARLRRSMPGSSRPPARSWCSPTPASCSTAARWRASWVTSAHAGRRLRVGRGLRGGRWLRGAVRPHGAVRSPGRSAAALDCRSERLLLRHAASAVPAVPARHGARFPLGAGHRALRPSGRVRARGARRHDGHLEPACGVLAQGAHVPARTDGAVRQCRAAQPAALSRPSRSSSGRTS